MSRTLTKVIYYRVTCKAQKSPFDNNFNNNNSLSQLFNFYKQCWPYIQKILFEENIYIENLSFERSFCQTKFALKKYLAAHVKKFHAEKQ